VPDRRRVLIDVKPRMLADTLAVVLDRHGLAVTVAEDRAALRGATYDVAVVCTPDPAIGAAATVVLRCDDEPGTARVPTEDLPGLLARIRRALDE
jgi:hypothetical protein